MKNLIILCLLLMTVFAFTPVENRQQSSSEKPDNIITRENSRQGTENWMLTKVKRNENEPSDEGWHRRKGIEGYVSHMSIKAGDTLNIYVSTDPASYYKIEIYRMGYYGGKGGRLMKMFKPHLGDIQKGITQVTPSDGPFNMIECNWEVSARLKIPEDWVSGVYLGKLSTFYDVEADAYFIFIVKDDRKADILVQCSDFTWQSYNRWPAKRSMYDSPRSMWDSRKHDSYAAGFFRPYTVYLNPWPAEFEPLTNGSGEFLLTEFPLVYWLEKEGYDVSYVSQMDVFENSSELLRSKVFVSVGHDEYLPQKSYDNITNARNEGVNIAFLCGNSYTGRVELIRSAYDRTKWAGMRSVKHVTGNYTDPDLMGSTSYGVGHADWTCVAPDHWVFEGSGMKKGDIIPELVGWEYHGPPLAEYHKDFEILAEGPVVRHQGADAGDSRYASTIYTAPKGNYVFNAGTIWWCKGLSSPPGNIVPPYVSSPLFEHEDPRVQRITKNVIDRMIAVELTE